MEREGGMRSGSILRKMGSQPELTMEGDNGGNEGIHWMRVTMAPVAAGNRGERCPR
jgi:hypothetical protein